ncbi:MAG: hypothetical protein K0R66_789 [Gammaproteobacteria bacterium]|nr:hypothetical protein [Gammaproteobacteria bacterium]
MQEQLILSPGPVNPPRREKKSSVLTKSLISFGKIAAAVGAVIGISYGVTAFYNATHKKGEASEESDYGLSGLLPEGYEFCGHIPAMPFPYVYGMPHEANASWGAKTNATSSDLQCSFKFSCWVPQPINATSEGSVKFPVWNPVMHRRAAETVWLDCTGTKKAFLSLNASYESEGKRAERNSTIIFNPALCSEENKAKQYKTIQVDSALCF